MKETKNLKVKTTYPSTRPPFNEWCNMFKVSSMHIDRKPIENANRIMALWDGYLNTKRLFVKFEKALISPEFAHH